MGSSARGRAGERPSCRSHRHPTHGSTSTARPAALALGSAAPAGVRLCCAGVRSLRGPAADPRRGDGVPCGAPAPRGCPSPKPRPATRGVEFGSAAWLHGEQNVAEAGQDRAMPASLPGGRGATASPPRGGLATQRRLSDCKHWGVGAPGGTRTPGIRLRSPSAFGVFSASCRTGSTIEGTNRFAGQRHRQRLSPPPPGHVQSSPCPPRATITGSPIRHRVDSAIHQGPSKHPVERRQAAPASPASQRPLSPGSPSLVHSLFPD